MSKTLKIALASMFAFAFAFVANTQASYPATNFAGNMMMGSTGAGVKELQMFLNACPDTALAVNAGAAGSVGYETMTFGPATKAAVMKYQAKVGVITTGNFYTLTRGQASTVGNVCGGAAGATFAPAGCTSASGYSPVTGGACYAVGAASFAPAGCTSASGYSPVTGGACYAVGANPPANNGPLAGGAGSIDDADFISSISNEDVGEDQNDIKVLGLDVDADSGSDLSFTSIKVEFEEQGAGGSGDLDDYADEVSIWLGSTKVGSADVEDFDEDAGVWSKNISLSNAIVRAGKTGQLYVAVSALSNIDSSDLGQANNDWDVAVASLRYMDAQNAVVTDTSTGDIGDIDTRDFQFDTFISSNDIELTVALDTDTPEEGIVMAEENDNTENVVVLKGTLKAEGADINIDSLPFTITSSGSDVDDLTSSFTLKLDGNEVGNDMSPADGTDDNYDATVTETAACAGTSCTITFDDLDFDLDEGDTVDFELIADINELDGVTLTNGDTLLAKVTTTGAEAIEAEAGNEDLTATEISGSAVGETQHFFEVYADVSIVNSPTNVVVVDNADVSTVTFKVKVTAKGGDIYMNGVGEATAAKEAFQLSTLGGGAGTSTLSAPSYTVTGATSNGNSITNADADNEYYTIVEDQSVTFTVTATITQTVASTTVGAEVDSILFGTDATSDTTRSALRLNWADLTDDLETPLVTLVP